MYTDIYIQNIYYTYREDRYSVRQIAIQTIGQTDRESGRQLINRQIDRQVVDTADI